MGKRRKRRSVTVQFLTANIKRKLRRHLANLGFQKNDDGELQAPGTGKEVIRALHAAQRSERLGLNEDFISNTFPSFKKYFACGSDIDPSKISPFLQRISGGTWESELFRLASLTWSVPVSNGFGRRIRYLVWDKNNEKLIGLIAIGDPVFNLSVRDNLIGWNVKDRGERLVNMMDAYVLGALPPYNSLLGGKLVACLVRTKEVYEDFLSIYGNTTGIISKQKKKARLLVVTTSSSMGRSSVYNRLKLDGVEYFQPLGYTGGWGHFHIPSDLFSDLRNYLRKIKHTYADLHRFGEGPNWRLRTTRAALSALGFKEDMLRHGIQREVFLCQFATNSLSLLRRGKGKPNLSSLRSVEEVGKLAVNRWILPRAEKRPEYKLWNSDEILTFLQANQKKMESKSSLTA